jgi:hypothetical protein
MIIAYYPIALSDWLHSYPPIHYDGDKGNSPYGRKEASMMIKNEQGVAINYEAAVKRMDKGIKDELKVKLGACDEGTFFAEYCKCHRTKHGREFVPNTPDPSC